MFKEIMSNYTKIVEYSIYLLISLNILDSMSTYIGIKYFNAYEANEKVAYLFDSYGMLYPMILKVMIAIILSYIIKKLWDRSEYLLSDKRRYVKSVVIISNINALFILMFLNFAYFFILVNNLTIIYWLVL